MARSKLAQEYLPQCSHTSDCSADTPSLSISTPKGSRQPLLADSPVLLPVGLAFLWGWAESSFRSLPLHQFSKHTFGMLSHPPLLGTEAQNLAGKWD